MALRLTAVLLAAAALAGCVAANPKAKSATPFEELTIQNIVRWPDGREYLESTGIGHPTYGEKDVEKRRAKAREDAAMEAQEKLISMLGTMSVPRGKVRELLKRAEVGRMDYGYDDTCTLVLRIPKELITGTVEEPLR